MTDERITSLLGNNAQIWSLIAEGAHNDIVRCPQDQTTFRTALRGLFDRIKARHGSKQIIHLFPALPASLAVETGRVWMPKADMTFQIYDEIRDCGFVRALAIGDTHMTGSHTTNVA